MLNWWYDANVAIDCHSGDATDEEIFWSVMELLFKSDCFLYDYMALYIYNTTDLTISMF